MDWKNLYNKASDGLNTFQEETSQIESNVSLIVYIKKQLENIVLH